MRRGSGRRLAGAARLAAIVAVAIAGAAPSLGRAQLGTRAQIPVPIPSRPFLLVDAPRRFSSAQRARVRVQLREGGRAQVALFAVSEPAALLGQAGRRQGVSVASGTLGAEAEALLGSRGPMPRRGARLVLTAARRLEMPAPHGPRRITDEVPVYDSNEEVEDGVATYWVAGGRWSVREVDLGRLPAGLYLVQVRAGAWVSSALLSVGDLVLLARRGDERDLVRVSGPNGAPRRGVVVVARDGERVLGRATTDASGLARLPASDAASVRFVARRGADLAWVDVSHVRLSRCDPRVYLATGRPLYRHGEDVFVRGHVRGCDAQGRYVGAPGRELTIRGGGRSVDATTDADGNFTARVAAGAIVAELDGREVRREVRIDDRELPRRALRVDVDRPWAAAGQTVTVTVADLDGGWPRPADVVLDTPSGRLVSRVGPGSPAVFSVQVPRLTGAGSPGVRPPGALERVIMHASLTDGNRTTMASAELWAAAEPLQLALRADAARGEAGQPVSLRVRAELPSGAPSPGPVELAIFGSDGNEPVGPARRRARLQIPEGGEQRASLPLEGEGPWMLVARRGAVTARLPIWARERPPSLSPRGPLAVLPRQTRVRPAEALELDVRLPRGAGRAWLTLEQSGVLVSRSLHSAARRTRVHLEVPERARGPASVVLTHVRGGRVSTASATVEVQTAAPMSLGVRTDRAVYGRGQRARVTIEGRTEAGQPHDGVISLWLADAGYWGLGEDDYPLPEPYLRLPGRPASGGDSTQPVAYGAEEGRVFDSKLEWDGRRLPRSTHRHGWGHGGQLIRRLRAQGSLPHVLRALATAAGFDGARVRCESPAEHRLHVQALPWDLVALRLGDELGAHVSVQPDALVFDCRQTIGSGSGSLRGRGARAPRIRTGSAGSRSIREQRLEGTLHFVSLARLGPDGRLELDVPLPDHPGRWRVEVLAVSDDGGGARGHAVVHTRQPLEAWLNVPATIGPNDRVRAEALVAGHGLASDEVRVELSASGGDIEGGPPARVRLDATGRARIPFWLRPGPSSPGSADRSSGDALGSLRAAGPGRVQLVVRAQSGTARDEVRRDVAVAPGWAEHELRVSAALGPEATEVDVPLPALAAPTTLRIRLPRGVGQDVRRVLEGLRRPRWDAAFARVDRLASLGALWRALEGDRSGSAQLSRTELWSAARAELHALEAMRGSDGTFHGARAGLGLELQTLLLARELGVELRWRDTEARIREGAERGELRAAEAAMASLWAEPRGQDARGQDARGQDARGQDARGQDAPRTLRRALAEAGSDPRALRWIARAARAAGARSVAQQAADRLAAWIRTRLASPSAAGSGRCRGWVGCMGVRFVRAELCRSAVALSEMGRAGSRRLAAEVVSALSERAMVSERPMPSSDHLWALAEAELVELLASLQREGAPAADPYVARVDGQRVPAPGGRLRIGAGQHRLTLRFAARPGRARRVLLRGRARIEPPTRPLGEVELTRRFDWSGPEPVGLVGFRLPEPSSAVSIRVPLPAGVTADHRRLGPTLMAIEDGAIHLRLTDLSAGRHEVRLPLLEVARGDYDVGPAHLQSEDGGWFGLTPASRVTIP